MSAYAVKIGTYVELRVSAVGLRAVTSKLTKPTFVTKEVLKHSNARGYYLAKQKVKQNLVMQQTFYVGGEVVKVLSQDSYNTLAKKFAWPMFGQIMGAVKLPLLVADPKWRKNNL